MNAEHDEYVINTWWIHDESWLYYIKLRKYADKSMLARIVGVMKDVFDCLGALGYVLCFGRGIGAADLAMASIVVMIWCDVANQNMVGWYELYWMKLMKLYLFRVWPIFVVLDVKSFKPTSIYRLIQSKHPNYSVPTYWMSPQSHYVVSSWYLRSDRSIYNKL